jgi:hypothetical protein
VAASTAVDAGSREEHARAGDLDVGERRRHRRGPSGLGRERGQVVGLERVHGRGPRPVQRLIANPGAHAHGLVGEYRRALREHEVVARQRDGAQGVGAGLGIAHARNHPRRRPAQEPDLADALVELEREARSGQGVESRHLCLQESQPVHDRVRGHHHVADPHRQADGQVQGIVRIHGRRGELTVPQAVIGNPHDGGAIGRHERAVDVGKGVVGAHRHEQSAAAIGRAGDGAGRGGPRALRAHLTGAGIVELVFARRGRVELGERAAQVHDAAADERGGGAADQAPRGRGRHVGAHADDREGHGQARQAQRQQDGARARTCLRLPHSTLVPRPPRAPRG